MPLGTIPKILAKPHIKAPVVGAHGKTTEGTHTTTSVNEDYFKSLKKS